MPACNLVLFSSLAPRGGQLHTLRPVAVETHTINSHQSGLRVLTGMGKNG